jgi:hypothetical protein
VQVISVPLAAVFWVAVDLDEDVRGFPVTREYSDRQAAEEALRDGGGTCLMLIWPWSAIRSMFGVVPPIIPRW